MLRVKTIFQNSQGGAPYLNVMHFGGADDAAAAANAVEAVGAFWGAVDAWITDFVTWSTDPDVLVINPADGVIGNVLVTTPQTGTGAGSTESLSRALQGLVTWKTSLFTGGRRLIGHTYIPALTENANDEGNVISTAKSAFLTAANALINDVDTDFGIWSKTRGVLEGVDSAVIGNTFAILRSRRD